jgi:hypothetical protein
LLRFSAQHRRGISPTCSAAVAASFREADAADDASSANRNRNSRVQSVSNGTKTTARIGKRIHGKLDMYSTLDTYFFNLFLFIRRLRTLFLPSGTSQEAPHLTLES